MRENKHSQRPSITYIGATRSNGYVRVLSGTFLPTPPIMIVGHFPPSDASWLQTWLRTEPLTRTKNLTWSKCATGQVRSGFKLLLGRSLGPLA